MKASRGAWKKPLWESFGLEHHFNGRREIIVGNRMEIRGGP